MVGRVNLSVLPMARPVPMRARVNQVGLVLSSARLRSASLSDVARQIGITSMFPKDQPRPLLHATEQILHQMGFREAGLARGARLSLTTLDKFLQTKTPQWLLHSIRQDDLSPEDKEFLDARPKNKIVPARIRNILARAIAGRTSNVLEPLPVDQLITMSHLAAEHKNIDSLVQATVWVAREILEAEDQDNFMAAASRALTPKLLPRMKETSPAFKQGKFLAMVYEELGLVGKDLEQKLLGYALSKRNPFDKVRFIEGAAEGVKHELSLHLFPFLRRRIPKDAVPVGFLRLGRGYRQRRFMPRP